MFNHQHRWNLMESREVKGKTGDVAQFVVRFEQCDCGAVRTVEYSAGKAPIIREPEMTKKDFELIAKIMRCNAAPIALVQTMANALAKENPNFDREKFVAACTQE